MKFIITLLSSVALFAASSEAVADCTSFTSSCSSSCSSIFSTSANQQCSAFSAYCSCPGAQDQTKGAQFCAQQKTTCSNTICQSSSNIDSFSCDPWISSSQCMCKSQSNELGGPMLGYNETRCVQLVAKCSNQLCSGKQVQLNTCTSPANAVCQCVGDSQPRNTTTGQALSSGAEPSNLVFLHGVNALTLVATFSLLFF